MSKVLSLFLSLSLVGLISCGSDDDDNGSRRSSIPQEEEIQARDFSTRIDNNLLVEGTQCQGGETTEYDNETYICQRGQWLMVLDNMNTCTDDGICTEIFVHRVVAELNLTEGPDNNYNYAVINAVSPVSNKQQEVIDNVYVRSDFNGVTEAVRR